MVGGSGAHDYAAELAIALEDIGAKIPRNFRAMFLGHARRLPEATIPDLATIVVIECLEARKAGKLLDELEVRRAVDRVRHRLSRQALKFQGQMQHGGLGDIPSKESSPVTLASNAEDAEYARAMLSILRPREIKAVELWMQNEPLRVISKAVGLSPESSRQLLHRALKRLREVAPRL